MNINVIFYRASIRNISDYSPFGVQLSERTISGDGYRFGFNGMEADYEVKGSGNSYDFGARMYDPRVGRWLTIDPLSDKYPSLSPYNFVSNSPLMFIDPDGNQIFIYYDSGEKDENNKPILKSYLYGSKIKKPRDKFVRKSIRTLNKSQRMGRDPNGIVKNLANSETENVAIFEKEDWKSSSFSVQVGEIQMTSESGETFDASSMENAPDLIAWNTNSGIISPDGKQRISPANALLHEMGHKAYDKIDPYGKVAEMNNIETNFKGEEKENLRDAFYAKQREECGDYHNYEDMWLIKEVEQNMGEGERKNHSDGYFLHTKGGTFSTRGTEYGKNNEGGNTKDLPKQ